MSAGVALKPADGTGSTGGRPFNERLMKADGWACTSPKLLEAIASCSDEEGDQSQCDRERAQLVARGDCMQVAKGAVATIRAGSHSFEWVRVKLEGKSRELWLDRSLLLD
jgi:hypothetical protein